MLWCKDDPSTPKLSFTVLRNLQLAFSYDLKCHQLQDLLLLTRRLQNADIIGDGKNIHSFSIYYELVKSNFWYLKIEELTEWEIFGEWGEWRSDFAIWGLGRHERKSILGVLCRCWESLKSRIRDLWKLGEKIRECQGSTDILSTDILFTHNKSKKKIIILTKKPSFLSLKCINSLAFDFNWAVIFFKDSM